MARGHRMKIHSRKLNEADFQAMKVLLLKEGPNDWNYITDESMVHQFQLINQGKAVAVLAEDTNIVGFAVLIIKEACPAKLSKYAVLSDIAYINDVVVASSQSGKGLGSQLLKESIKFASDKQCSHIYIERHEENLASAGMMRKAGFNLVETFYDPEKRATGSKNTSVLSRCT
ncbi:MULTISPECIES: GNAT family N-acetyltransferase [unclassified Colwellia]|uniref:GNAT family N-acetyltransferase n=2 Tax=unclassified Colwellia TaxID=196834 RepID=UPI001C713D3E|nr:GNAT family N-acetyltransferase [Colwellia sp. MB3u-41]